MMKALYLSAALSTVLAAATQPQTFTGVITDTMCGKTHGMMAGQPDAECTTKCVKGSSSQYALFDGNWFGDGLRVAAFFALLYAVLRLAGSVNYPTEKKAARGYVPELTTLKKIDNAPTYQADYLISLAGPNNGAASNTEQHPQGDKRSTSSGDAFADYANDHDLEADPEMIASVKVRRVRSL